MPLPLDFSGLTKLLPSLDRPWQKGSSSLEMCDRNNLTANLTELGWLIEFHNRKS